VPRGGEVGVEAQVLLAQLTHQMQFLEPILLAWEAEVVLLLEQVQTVVQE
jgi:hypothetical protein